MISLTRRPSWTEPRDKSIYQSLRRATSYFSLLAVYFFVIRLGTYFIFMDIKNAMIVKMIVHKSPEKRTIIKTEVWHRFRQSYHFQEKAMKFIIIENWPQAIVIASKILRKHRQISQFFKRLTTLAVKQQQTEKKMRSRRISIDNIDTVM